MNPHQSLTPGHVAALRVASQHLQAYLSGELQEPPRIAVELASRLLATSLAGAAGAESAQGPGAQSTSTTSFQERVSHWLVACFGEAFAGDRAERSHRFLEEALELVQACDCTADEAHQLVDYVFGRPVGEKEQEAGGTMTTFAALCLTQGIDMQQAGEAELRRIWGNIEKIRAKRAAKPNASPLPGYATPHPTQAAASLARLTQVAPAEQGWYWHWNGDEECSPVPTSVLWSGTTNKCFVSTGQLGLTRAIDCDKYGGFWLKMTEPWGAVQDACAQRAQSVA